MRSAVMEPLVGQIVMFAGTFAPRGWAPCDGRLLPIERYQLLYSLLGTAHGGDGRETFGVPDLRGRPEGQGPSVEAPDSDGARQQGPTQPVPTGQAAARMTDPVPGVTFIIALEGIYPSRN